MLSNTRLYCDLYADRREAMYCALTYIEQCGGPAFTGSAQNLAQLLASRASAYKWLSQRDDRETILAGYPGFVMAWSPAFED